jgi:hypothetical protein
LVFPQLDVVINQQRRKQDPPDSQPGLFHDPAGQFLGKVLLMVSDHLVDLLRGG